MREAGFTERQAQGQARALAALMTDSLATKADLREQDLRMAAGFEAAKADLKDLETRMQAGFEAVAVRMGELEKRMELRLRERLADLERRMTVRLLAGVAAISALSRTL